MNGLKLLLSLPGRSLALLKRIQSIEFEMEQLRLLVGDVAERCHVASDRLQDHEFRVSSQWGEDGIISYLVDQLGITRSSFIEFGVESYRESNTRWLIQKRNWRGLVIDGSHDNVNQIKSDQISWRHQLTAVCSFITAESINGLFTEHGFLGDIGLLSIDIDGVDYWVWKGITVVSPIIVVVEYNSLFGWEQAVTVPYRPDFVRTKAHHSSSYYGASLAALVKLGKEKGYSFVGSNSAGNNAFFVRKDLMRAPLKELSAKEGYVQRGFRESKDAMGNLTLPSFEEEAKSIAHLPLVEV